MRDRTMHQRMQDDEDHRLQMCGDLEADRDDPRVRFEREDFEQGKYDFIFGPTAGSANTLPSGSNGGESSHLHDSPPPTFASPPAIAGAFGGVASPHRTSDTGGGKAHGPDRPPTDGVVKGRPLPSSEGGRPATFNQKQDA
jgi:hypothetical protein